MPVTYTVEVRTGAIEHELLSPLLDRFASSIFADRHLLGPAILHDALVNALELRATVKAARADIAIGNVVDAFERALKAAHIVATQSRIEAWQDIEGVDWPDELVNGGEVARRLKISRERLRQLVTEKPLRIPRPVAETERDRIWRWGDIAEWAALKERATKVPRRRRAPAIREELIMPPIRARQQKRSA
jgi:hypothetical protein